MSNPFADVVSLVAPWLELMDAAIAQPERRHLPLAADTTVLACVAAHDCRGWCATARPPERHAAWTMQRSHAALRAGEVIDERWRLRHRLGDGGSAEVWLAHDPSQRRDVAIKLLRPEHLRDADMVGRFAMETRALPRVRHPNVVRMLGHGSHRGRPFIVMEHVVGLELAAVLAALGKQRMPIGRALGILRGLLEGLAAMHAAGVLHGDVKPSNVIIAANRVVLVDLGLAHPLGPSCRSRLGVVFGTPKYLAPELAAGRADRPNAVTDVYAAAALAFELLTGRPPFSSASVQDMLRAQIEFDVPAPTRLRPDLSRALEQALLRALDKSPEQRTPSIARLHAELMAAARPYALG